jgi:hypothetical protein
VNRSRHAPRHPIPLRGSASYSEGSDTFTGGNSAARWGRKEGYCGFKSFRYHDGKVAHIDLFHNFGSEPDAVAFLASYLFDSPTPATRHFCGGEAFAYALQALKRAQAVGERTGGGAHIAVPIRVREHFRPIIPYSPTCLNSGMECRLSGRSSRSNDN